MRGSGAQSAYARTRGDAAGGSSSAAANAARAATAGGVDRGRRHRGRRSPGDGVGRGRRGERAGPPTPLRQLEPKQSKLERGNFQLERAGTCITIHGR